jgi:hypothetical protein
LFTDTLLATPIQAEFKVVQQRGRNTVIIVDEFGYSYSCNSKGAQIKSWRCSKRKQKNCTASIRTDDGWIISRKNAHRHEISDLFGAVSVESDNPIVQEYFRQYR